MTAVGAAISCRSLEKRFGATTALRGISLEITPGTVHSLVGENGAGKSTCLGIISGRVDRTAGQVLLDGVQIPYGQPRAIRRLGVTAIYQELSVVPALSTQANVFLSEEIATGGVLRESAMRLRFLELCDDFGVQLPVNTRTGSLSVAQQQTLEVLRALEGSPRLILFDEPTAALSEAERESFYRLVRRLNGRGISLVLVSHNLEEVLNLSDHITVFRDGTLVASAPAAEWSKPALIREMAGERLIATASQLRDRSDRIGNKVPLLQVEHLTVRGAIEDISFHVNQGEVLGLVGLAGSGRSTLLNALGGLYGGSRGQLMMGQTRHKVPRSCIRSRALGIQLIPEDRKSSGIIPSLSVADNVVLSSLRSVSRVGMLSRRRTFRRAWEASVDFALTKDRMPQPARALSGGNQQKLLFARGCFAKPRILLADEPTRGVDTAAKAEILRSVRALAAQGICVIVASSELEDVLEVSDRILVLAAGRLVAEHEVSDDLTPESLLQDAFGLGGPH